MGIYRTTDRGSFPAKLRCWATLGHDIEREQEHRIGYGVTTRTCQHCGKQSKVLTPLPVP